jgi:hypothetical protein
VRSVRQVEKAYSPAITILAEPSLFLALVPAKAALDVARQIKRKYEEEMARVRDRLPLYLGMVFAPRRTPVRALLEAGRQMLKMPHNWEQWEVTSTSSWDADNPPANGRRSITFSSGITWDVPLMIDDQSSDGKKTPDNWYPHFLLKNPSLQSAGGSILEHGYQVPGEIKHARDLNAGDKVYVHPSRFDFEFLDTTARRFEIRYDDNGHRQSYPKRPFYLEHLDQFKELWDALKTLNEAQIHNLRGMLVERIIVWHGGES